MTNGKKKGNRGELKIAKILTEHFKLPFKRVPTSGAFSTIHMDMSQEALRTLSGDLIVPPSWVFSLEVKTGYKVDLISLFSDKSTTDKTTISEFCEQASEDAAKVEGRIPMVIYTKDRRETVCILPKNNHSREKELKKLLQKENTRYMCVPLRLEDYKQWGEWIVISLPDLLDNLERSFFLEDDEI